MKLFVALAASAASLAAAADVPACQVTQLKALTESPDVALCVTKSGVVFSALQSTPSDAQLARMCETDECVALLAAILKLDPADCTLPVDGGIALRSQLVDPAVAYCKKSGVQVGADNTGSSSSASGGSASVGTVKAADTTSPSSVAATANTTTNSTSPAPTPSSGAAAQAMVAASSVIALVAVASAVL